MAADIHVSTLPSNNSPSSLSANLTRSSGFASFTRDTKSMGIEELESEYQRLRDENHQLQLRILGVNELARLLQDKNEQLQFAQEKNKRLEVAVVRLENRCANIEKLSKTQGRTGHSSLPAKTGQSPFIPGPSRQILEGLMKENSELKKTLNNMSKKGDSGYLEAVKITQLEDVIGCQQEELQFLKEQIKQLTDEEPQSAASSKSGAISLPAHVTDSGPLKRQLIKLQQAAKVKDRFCGLLSQQIAELQGQLSIARQQAETPTETSKERLRSVEPDNPDVEIKYKRLLDEANSELQGMRDQHISTLEKLGGLEKQLKERNRETEDIDKLRDQLDFHIGEKQDILETLKTAQSDLEELMSKGSKDGTDGISPESHKKVERERDDLRKVLEERTNQHTEERKEYESQILMLKTQLENEEMKRAIANSEMELQIRELGQEKAELSRKIEQKDDKITDLHDSVESHQSEIQELREKVRDYNLQLSTMRYAGPGPLGTAGNVIYRGSPMIDPALIYPHNNAGAIIVKDGTTPLGDNRSLPTGHCETPFKFTDSRPQVMSRNPESRNHERPTQLPPNPQQYTFPSNIGRSSPSMSQGGAYYSGYGGSMTPVSQQPRVVPATIHPPQQYNRSPTMFRAIPNNSIPNQGRGIPLSPHRSVTTPITVATSPTFVGGRMGNYSQQGMPGEHPLTTTSSMYSHTSPPALSGQSRMAPPSSGMRLGHTYQRSDDENSYSGGQRSPSPNPHQPR